MTPVTRKAFDLDIEIVNPLRKKAGQPRYAVITRRGKLFDVDGVSILLFPARVFAEAVGRTTRTIRQWEDDGTLPKPMWVNGGSKYRLYSKNQILLAQSAWKKIRDRPKNNQELVNQMLGEIRAGFHRVDLPEGVTR